MVRNTCSIIKGEEVIKVLNEGSKEIADAVSVTFGPNGRNVAITMLYNLPHVTKDGVTVARSINLLDQGKDVAAQIIKQAAQKTADIAGDGTTSTVILTKYLVEYCFEYLQKNPNDSTSLKYSLIKLAEDINAKIDNDIKYNISNKEDVFNIAMVSSNGDLELSKMVSDIFDTIGKDGIVTVQSSNSYNTIVQATEGIRLDRGHISPILEKDNLKKTYNDVAILATDLDFKTFEDGLQLVELQRQVNKPLLVICNDLIGSALNVVAHNKINLDCNIEIIRAPHIADARREAIKDLCIITGGVVYLKDEGYDIQSITSQGLGTADSFEISPKETFIIGRNGDPDKIKERINYYNEKIEADTEGLKENYKKRLSMFTSGASVIFVGGSNEIEVQEKKDRLDDTIRACKAALQEGVVPGGCITYHDITEWSEVSAAGTIFRKAVEGLVKTFLGNSDQEMNDETIFELRNNVVRGNIVDPALVIKSTITNAVGAAIMIFTTDCIVIKHDPQ